MAGLGRRRWLEQAVAATATAPLRQSFVRVADVASDDGELRVLLVELQVERHGLGQSSVCRRPRRRPAAAVADVAEHEVRVAVRHVARQRRLRVAHAGIRVAAQRVDARATRHVAVHGAQQVVGVDVHARRRRALQQRPRVAVHRRVVDGRRQRQRRPALRLRRRPALGAVRGEARRRATGAPLGGAVQLDAVQLTPAGGAVVGVRVVEARHVQFEVRSPVATHAARPTPLAIRQRGAHHWRDT